MADELKIGGVREDQEQLSTGVMYSDEANTASFLRNLIDTYTNNSMKVQSVSTTQYICVHY